MANVLLRGLDPATLARLRADARRRGISVNRLIVETLQRQHAAGETYHDLDTLAGRWSKSEAAAFDAAVAPFSEIDRALWAAQPRAAARARGLGGGAEGGLSGEAESKAAAVSALALDTNVYSAFMRGTQAAVSAL